MRAAIDDPDPSAVPHLLERHLKCWLGTWPPEAPVEVVERDIRRQAGWDDAPHPLVGVGSPGGLVLSVAPGKGAEVASAVAGLHPGSEAFLETLALAVGEPGRPAVRTVFRWCTAPTYSDDIGVWLDADDPRVPSWLRPFGGLVLVAMDGDDVVSGVGVKRHDDCGHELAVVTTAPARGRGLASLLIEQAARRVLAEGALPTYLHLPDNEASARVAESAGFVDRGWTAYALADR